MSAGGTALKSGNAVNKIFTIAHNLGTTPDFASVEAASEDALGEFKRTIDATNITLTYAVAPATGTNNLSYIWGVGFVGQAVAGFTPTSIDALTNKSIADSLKFSKVATPATQANLEDAMFYNRTIDANNNGIFCKVKKAGAIAEVQIL